MNTLLNIGFLYSTLNNTVNTLKPKVTQNINYLIKIARHCIFEASIQDDSYQYKTCNTYWAFV